MTFVIAADVHLTRDGSRETARDLASIVERHRGATLVFAGDLFDLAAESVHGPADRNIAAVLDAHAGLRRALGEHVMSGGGLVLLAGNHDDELATTAGLEAVRASLELDHDARGRVRGSPWFVRLGPTGALHVEHGHHYDADNALPHPLAPPDASYRSLGIGLMHRFIAPIGANALVHSNDATPLQCLWRTVELFGPRAPEVIARYFSAAFLEFANSGSSYPSARAREAGERALAAFCAAERVAPEAARKLVALGTRPTKARRSDAFFRLYWDRVGALAVASVAGASALVGGPGLAVALAACGVLAGSIAVGRNRYRGRAPDALRDNAPVLARATAARHVVFGHIHAPVVDGCYRNTGSFGFPGSAPGRPYLVCDDEQSAPEHVFHPVS